MPYRYNYGALMSANTTNNNFKPLSEVEGTADHTNMATALLEAKGLTVGTTGTDNVLSNLPGLENDSQVELMQNIANLTKQDTGVARGNVWGASDDTQGRSWLRQVAEGNIELEGNDLQQVNQLYQQGMGRDADPDGLVYWGGQKQYGGASIQSIAQNFLRSEEATIKDQYDEFYDRDADVEGLAYFMQHTGQAGYEGAVEGGAHGGFNATDLVRKILSSNLTPETAVRTNLSESLGIHSTDAQRGGGVYTDANEAQIQRMIAAGDFGQAEIDSIMSMQRAASAMGDYGGGVAQEGDATGISRLLSMAEMGSVNEAGQWVPNAERLRMGASSYTPQINYTYNNDGQIVQARDSNVWSLLKSGTQDYEVAPVEEEEEENTGPNIVVNTQDVDYMPELTSDVQDTSSYGTSKEAFDNAAAGIDTPTSDMNIRSSQYMTSGKSAKGVRLKRSKKFKSGESALGTKQLGRQLQIKSLNI